MNNTQPPSCYRRLGHALVGATLSVALIVSARKLKEVADHLLTSSSVQNVVEGLHHQSKAIGYFAVDSSVAEFCDQVTFSCDVLTKTGGELLQHTAQVAPATSCGLASLLRRKGWEKYLLAVEVGCVTGALAGSCYLTAYGTNLISKIILGCVGGVVGTGVGTATSLGVCVAGSTASCLVLERSASDKMGLSVALGVGAYMGCKLAGQSDTVATLSSAMVGGTTAAYFA